MQTERDYLWEVTSDPIIFLTENVPAKQIGAQLIVRRFTFNCVFSLTLKFLTLNCIWAIQYSCTLDVSHLDNYIRNSLSRLLSFSWRINFQLKILLLHFIWDFTKHTKSLKSLFFLIFGFILKNSNTQCWNFKLPFLWTFIQINWPVHL